MVWYPTQYVELELTMEEESQWYPLQIILEGRLTIKRLILIVHNILIRFKLENMYEQPKDVTS
jgi:hypothetical protein